MTRALMVLGTGSHAGKSLLATALCRIFRQDGLSVAPFKAQNMALNSAATPEGLEIGRAQALQAEAAGVAPSADMNPILLKPTGETGAQVVVRGRVAGHWSAADYHTSRAEELFPIAVECYRRLAARHELIVLEGAGSPAEVNLKPRDIVNLRMARAAGAACLLVGDIDRGGVFASLVGTFELLDDDERGLIRGFALNKFRGDVSLLKPGLDFLERRLERPCAGVVPYLRDVGLEEEDGVALEQRRTVARCWPEESGPQRRVRIGVVALPHLANFTDFDALAAEPSVALAFLARPDELARADLVVLPGTKQVLDDLAWLRRSGFAAALRARADAGGNTLGICGGLQMLGRAIEDPDGMEGGGRAQGLGLLDLSTRLAREKVTVRARGEWRARRLFGRPVALPPPRGYEIHLGATALGPGGEPLLSLWREGASEPVADGAASRDGRVAGSYLHGFADDDAFRHGVVDALRAACGLAPARERSRHGAERERRLDRLAGRVRASLDLPLLRSWLGLGPSARAEAGRC